MSRSRTTSLICVSAFDITSGSGQRMRVDGGKSQGDYLARDQTLALLDSSSSRSSDDNARSIFFLGILS